MHHNSSLTLQYAGMRFRRFMYALQQPAEGALVESMGWYNHIQHEVAELERLLGICHQQHLVMWVPAVTSQVMTWVTVREMESDELLCSIHMLNVLKVHWEEVVWWSSSQPAGLGFNNTMGLKQFTGEACVFFSEAVAQSTIIPTLIMLQGCTSGQPRLYMWASLMELIKDTDKKIHKQSALLYHYSNQLNTLEALTGSEFELIQQWVDTVKRRDDKLDNSQGWLQSR
ncbi:hypothetical protein J3A83DRAFT_4184550 [Scleroderma citrinum]